MYSLMEAHRNVTASKAMAEEAQQIATRLADEAAAMKREVEEAKKNTKEAKENCCAPAGPRIQFVRDTTA